MVKRGEVTEAVINNKVRRLLRLIFKTNMIGGHRTTGSYAPTAHAAVAKKIAEEGIILLKNSGNVLPLTKKPGQTIAVIGAAAIRENAMDGGSSQVLPKYEITPLKGLQNLLGKNAPITFLPGYTIIPNGGFDSKLIAEAVTAARNSATAIVFGGWIHGYGHDRCEDNAFDAEGFDKPNMNMPF